MRAKTRSEATSGILLRLVASLLASVAQIAVIVLTANSLHPQQQVLDLEEGERVSRMVRISTDFDEHKYFPLGNLSGGQFRRMELALLFAAREMSSFRVKSNLLVLDEPFQHLDQAGVIGVISCMKRGLDATSVLVPMQNTLGVGLSENFDNVTVVEHQGGDGSIILDR